MTFIVGDIIITGPYQVPATVISVGQYALRVRFRSGAEDYVDPSHARKAVRGVDID